MLGTRGIDEADRCVREVVEDGSGIEGGGVGSEWIGAGDDRGSEVDGGGGGGGDDGGGGGGGG